MHSLTAAQSELNAARVTDKQCANSAPSRYLLKFIYYNIIFGIQRIDQMYDYFQVIPTIEIVLNAWGIENDI